VRNKRASKRRLSPLALGLAIVVHAVVFGLMFVNIESRSRPVAVKPAAERPENIIDAVAVENAALEREKERKRQIELEKQRKLEEERKRVAEEKRKQEEARKKAEVEKQRKLEAERQRVAAEKKKKEEARKKAEAEKKRKEAEAKKKRDAERKKKLAEEKRRKAEAEKKRKAEAERKRKEAELKRKMEEEARQGRARAAMSEYVPRIQRKVEDNWRLPPQGAQGCNPTVRVNLAPDGKVLAAKIVKSSGDNMCDSSVERAFLRASPIPIPSDPDLYTEFRVIDFPFRP
jgi:colicin import membrane protein